MWSTPVGPVERRLAKPPRDAWNGTEGKGAAVTMSEREAFLDAVTAGVGRHISGIGRLGVAVSGGGDSSVLLALAARILGRDAVVAILGVSPSLAADERVGAHRVATFIGVEVVEVQTHEMDRAGYRANGPDRCFHCKDELFTRIDDEIATGHRQDAIASGENPHDARRPDRPGSRAAAGHRVLTPLAD